MQNNSVIHKSMTINEVSEKYCIPIELLKEYEEMELCGTVKRVMGVWQYDDSDLELLSLMMTLYDIGFTKKEVDEYIRISIENGNDDRKLRMLNKKRADVLDEVHFHEKKIENLDYLRFKIRKNKEI